jgi:hypothetical protein
VVEKQRLATQTNIGFDDGMQLLILYILNDAIRIEPRGMIFGNGRTVKMYP